MNLFSLTNEDKGHLKRLNDNKSAIFALEKFFLITCIKAKLPLDVNTLAAERIALDIIQDIFHQLQNMQPDSREGIKVENLV